MKIPFDSGSERICRAALSALVEPGDTAAGILVENTGPKEAIRWLYRVHETGIGADDARRPWAKAVSRWLPRLAGLEITALIERANKLGAHVVIPGDPQWPAQMELLGKSQPLALWVRGEIPAGKHISIVGARAPTNYGSTVAAKLAVSAAQANWCVVSGGAMGIDAAAHGGAMAAGGDTVAVLAGGIDRLYPASNTEMLLRIAASGAIVSEMPPGAAPTRHRFLTRNRLIAALGQATCVVEAAHRSGAINTARHCEEIGRAVAAIPGPVTSPASEGCHRLMREGIATCVTNWNQLAELASPAGENLAAQPAGQQGFLDGLDPGPSRILDSLPAAAATTENRLVRVSGLSPAQVRQALETLLLQGRVTRSGPNWRRA